jgi:hypothetical protein
MTADKKPADRQCVVPGCHRPHKARGYCGAHWQRWRKHGNPLSGGTEKGEARRFLEEVVQQYEGDECLIWPYARARGGRPEIRIDGRGYYVARLVCEQRNGPPPPGQPEAAHSCGRGDMGCVTPHHLRWASRSENEIDKVEHGTSNRGQAHGMSKLGENEVRKIRSLSRENTVSELATMFDVSPRTVRHILARTRWGWLS